MLVEICVQGIDAVLEAAEGGAERIELCENLAVGGVTPSAGTIAVARRVFPGTLHVIIRPRAGNFAYNPLELDIMRQDIDTCRSIGVDGVVLGVLDTHRALDVPRLQELIARARPLSVTFHRAFDESANPDEALEQLQALGVDRVLTSGKAPTVRLGLARLAAWRTRLGDRPRILAGGGGQLEDIPLLAHAGISEAHFATAAQRDGRTDARMVRLLVEAARSARRDQS